MASRELDRDYWQGRYDDRTDGWDIGAPSRPLTEYIDQLTDKHLRILIPGCGRAWEGEYLHRRDFTNVWLMDLTGGPFAEFLQRCPDFPQEHLITGDFFQHSGAYDLILEQTFFCAIDPPLRPQYVRKMSELLAAGGKLVGVLFDEPTPGRTPGEPPFGGDRAEYRKLFEEHFTDVRIEPCHNSIAPRAGREVWIRVLQ